jgi:ClpP class serine protease
MNKTLYNEIATTHMFEMDHNSFLNHARLFLSHYNSLSAEDKNNHPAEPYMLAQSSGFAEKIYLGRADRIARYERLDETDVVINVIHFSGPIMRNGGGCAYGSMELRDMIIQAANVPQCIAQVFVCDTPGGSSYSKFDFQEAIEYARSKGQKTVMYVDGMLASAGMAWGALCDRRYAHSGHCVFGSMGTYASFFTQKDGDVNSVTQEMFHEIYAEGSPMKNRPFRDSATGDNAMMQEDVNRSNLQYQEIIKSGIKNVTEEQLLGGTWEASEVIGTLCDGICSFDQVIDELLAEHGIRRGEQLPVNNEANAFSSEGFHEAKKSAEPNPEKEPDKKEPKDNPDENPDENPEGEPGCPDEPLDPNKPVDPESPDDVPEDEPDKKPEEPKAPKKSKNSKKNMGKSYQVIQAALGLEVLESGKDNALYLHEDLCESLSEVLARGQETETALEAKVEEVKTLNAMVAELRQEKQNALNEESEKANAALAEKEARINELEAEVKALNEKLEAKEAELKELADEPAEQKQPGVVNHEEDKAEVVLPSHFNSGKEQREAKAKFMEELRKRM